MNVFVVAATVQAFNERNAELRAAGVVEQSGDIKVVPVLRETDMRGRQVLAGDQVIVTGNWYSVQTGVVKMLCEMFNTRRVNEVSPLLRYRSGEAPEVVYPSGKQSPPPSPPPTVSVDNSYMTWSSTETTTTTNGPPGNQFTFGVETQVSPAGGGGWPSHTEAEVQRLADELKAAKEILARNDTLISGLVEQVRVLRSWLSGVQPVQDPDFPEILYCGCCQTRWPEHAAACPAAP